MPLSPRQITFRAALSRFLIGGAALVLVPWLYPRTRPHVWILVVYLAGSAVEQVLIAKDVGGRVRSMVAGIVDILVVTYFVHLLGSTSTVLAASYFFLGTMNSLVVGLRVGVAVAAVNALAYDTVIWAEYAGLLPFAPCANESTRALAPSFDASVMASALVTTFLIASTAVVGLLVHSVRRNEERLCELSQRDPLTGLYNRRFLFEKLEHELARTRRGHTLCVVMLDLDGFKHVNDEQGHLRGDLLLKEIAGGLATTTRVVDVVARYGGDEFLILLPDTDVAHGRVVAERIGEVVREVGSRFDPARPVTASVGVATAISGESIASLIRRADDSAYSAKRSGGNRVALADAA